MTDNALAMAQSALDRISSLQASVDMLISQAHSLDRRVHALGGNITPQGEAITGLTNTIESEASARCKADAARGTRTGGIQRGLTTQQGAASTATSRLESTVTAAQAAPRASRGKVLFQASEPMTADRLVQNLWIDTTGNTNMPKRWNGSAWVAVTDKVATDAAAARATSFLTSRITSTEDPTLEVDPGKAIEPLRLGKVTFYGESARVIRAAQAVLESAGAGQLEVVKREPFKITADGQVFISEALVGKAAIQKAQVDQHSVMPTEQPKPRDATEILEEISSQISESELGKDLASRIAELEQGKEKQDGENRSFNDRLTSLNLELVARRGEDSAARVRTDQRIDALQAQVDNLQGKVYSRD